MKDYSFGNYICALRTGLGLSQFQLGTLVGVTDKAVSKWENGDSKPRLSTCYRLAEVLGVTVNELLSCNHNTLNARKESNMKDNWLWKQAYDRLYSIYGNTPHIQCWNRLVSEENALKNSKAVQNYAILASIQTLAKQQNSYVLVDGVINASFTSWLLGATTVNPLPAHYYCPKCGNTEFVDCIRSGFDLPEKKCSCGSLLHRDGHNIPFECYVTEEHLATNISLQVSKNFLPYAIKVMQDFYSDCATILPISPNSEEGIQSVNYIIAAPTKRIPSLNKEEIWNPTIQEFFDWYENETIYSFIISPEINKMEEFIQTHPQQRPAIRDILDVDLFNLMLNQINIQSPNSTIFNASCEIPPFEFLLKRYSFEYDTHAWEGNGEELVNSGTANLRDIPSVREDIWANIMDKMIANGIHEHGTAIKIMENACKGIYCSMGMPAVIEKMLLSLGLPTWYPEYLKKLHYLCSKAQCVANLITNLQLIWYQQQKLITEQISKTNLFESHHLETIWFSVKKHLQIKFSEKSVALFLGEAKLVSINSGVLELQHHSDFYCRIIETHFGTDIIKAMKELYGLDISLNITNSSQLS